jgi:proteasome beta subunit|tara:strand:- start:313 stop:966 length:654 start_codon:yes stop_codon:yes gene_type:complete
MEESIMGALEKAEKYMKGTTTVGLTCKDGTVLVSDKRATMGTLIAHRIVKKSFMIDNHIGATVAGSVADAQAMIRWMQAEAKLYRMRSGKEMSVEAAATLLGNILFQQRGYPMIIQVILGGIDKKGARIFSLDPLGSCIEDNVIATGSGSPVAYGVLEDHYKENLSLDECTKIGIRSLKAALKRDAMTGDGIDVVEITSKGFRKLTSNQIEKISQTL